MPRFSTGGFISSACKVDGLYGNYGSTWAHKYAGYLVPALQTLPRVTTETGVRIEGAVTERIQALLYLSVYLDQFKRGWKHTAICLLRDRSDEAGNQAFGFYTKEYAQREAARYLHNLTTILGGAGTPKRPDRTRRKGTSRLAYAIPNQPETVHDLLLQKDDGTFALVVWDEQFSAESDPITVHLGGRSPSVKVYDPTVGTALIQTHAGVA